MPRLRRSRLRLIEGAHGKAREPKGKQRLQWYELGKEPPPAADPWLSPREREILMLLAQDMTEHEIARRLWISRFTVQQHTKNMRVRFGKRRMLGVYAEAQRRGLLDVVD